MLDRLRIPLFIVAIILIAIVVLAEAANSTVSQWLGTDTPGVGITTLSVLDGLVLFTVGLMGLALILRERLQGRVQGIITLIVSLLTLLGSIVFLIAIFVKLMLMITLLMSPPFGTIAYFVIYADFATGQAKAMLSFMMSLKLAFAVFLIFAHQRFLENKGLVLIIITALLGSIIVSFLHALVPGFLVSITDAIAGIIVLILVIIWAIFFLIGSIISVIKAITTAL